MRLPDYQERPVTAEALDRDAFREEQLAAGARLLPEPVRAIADIFCGCGSPAAAYEWVRDYLRQHRDGAYVHPLTGLEYVGAYLIDHLGLTEHGVNIAGCWLTPIGEEALAFLEEHGPDWSSRGWWIDRDGTTLSDPEAS